MKEGETESSKNGGLATELHNITVKPVTTAEEKDALPGHATAPGPDGLTLKELKALPLTFLAKLYNLFLWWERASRKKGRLFLANIDLRKAFESVTHSSIISALSRHELVGATVVNYLTWFYNNSTTTLTHGGVSRTVRPGRRVRQGDPLSPLLFNTVLDEFLAGIPEEFGVMLGERKCAALAFADDLVILAETQQGLQYLLEAFAVFLEERGFSINIEKSATLSMLGDGKYRRVKAVPINFTVQGHELPIIGISDSWAYLGVKMDALGTEKSDSMLEHMVELETWREMVEKAERNTKFGEMLIRTRVQEKNFWRSALVGMVDGRGLREARTAAKVLLDVPGGKTKTIDVELGVRLRKPTLTLSRYVPAPTQHASKDTTVWPEFIEAIKRDFSVQRVGVYALTATERGIVCPKSADFLVSLGLSRRDASYLGLLVARALSLEPSVSSENSSARDRVTMCWRAQREQYGERRKVSSGSGHTRPALSPLPLRLLAAISLLTVLWT
ncbi:hypothetical protein HPB47_009601 [Ixodes persulcatus]|uniref:Uncharacterized protein n=1 Tax=Ixodes persulcatus TaxID=34615 RepID=A0AC60P1R6_IXOPE|nr:hypothetical protein HPB47_009601 [Ixodes persulcatus]